MKISMSCVAGALVLAAASAATAQTVSPDMRWRPWLGCWSTVAPSTTMPVCVVPAPGTSAVDIVVVGDGKITSREHIEANGQRRRSERDGCTGWESAQWSADSRRVYLQSEFECSSGKRTSSGLIAMSPQGEWLDIVGVTLRDNTGVRVLRHRAMGPTPIVPAEVVAALEGTAPSFRDAAVRNTVAGEIGTAEVAEAARQLKPQVVEAWLSESGQEFTVNAKRLVALAAAGVPDRIIDVIVALSYPTAFAVRPSSTSAGLLTSDESRGGGGIDADASLGSGCLPFSWSMYGWDACSPFGYQQFGALGYRYGYNPIGFMYSPYGYGGLQYLGYGGLGYNSYGGGWYQASQPTVIVLSPGSNGAQHGQVVNGRGYVEGGNASSAIPVSSGSSSSGSSSSSGGSSSGGGSSSSPSSGGGGGDSGGRTAVPR
jgi:hypothetical protein